MPSREEMWGKVPEEADVIGMIVGCDYQPNRRHAKGDQVVTHFGWMLTSVVHHVLAGRTLNQNCVALADVDEMHTKRRRGWWCLLRGDTRCPHD